MEQTTRHVLSEQELKGLQAIELELLVEFDRICKKNNIIYSIDGGTLLGAIRHGGFIPWDDDADVIMVRAEYDKFKKACEKELNADKFYLQDMDNTPGYRWGYAKLRRKDTQFIRLNQEHMPYEQGIFMDVFICDNVPENYVLRSLCNFKSYIYRKFFWSEVGKELEKGIKKKVLQIMNLLPENKLKERYHRYIDKRNKKYSNWVKCLTFPACNNTYGYKREWYEDVADLPFEGVNLSACKKYEEYLTFLYGNYMQLPPEEKRKVHPVSKFKLPN